MKAHKYKELIKAWADGAVIESRDRWTVSADWRVTTNPSWSDTMYEYRIKPTPKPDYRKYFFYQKDLPFIYPCEYNNLPNIVLFFDGETDEIKSAGVVK